GLISYTTSQRSKEVGIRKVLGASAGSIVGLFTREFVVLVVLGFAVSAPVAYYVMQNWLENFAYRINLGTGLFLIALGVSLLIALGTVGYKTYRTAQINPVEAIRNE
ncbi:MAG TPA: FtsX-like permease family protein, partial [Rhodothermales bacterium]|nr:FtsX-like permease family protein [Rhodothermales bacterium]